MYESYWGLSKTPFQNSAHAGWYFETRRHEEAIARLLFLIEQRRTCGLLTGAAGTGKSLSLKLAQNQIDRTSCIVARLDASGLLSNELLGQLAGSLGLACDETGPPQRIWHAIEDLLNGLRLSRMQLVVMFDHFDPVDSDNVRLFERLIHLDSGPERSLTLIVATTNNSGDGGYSSNRLEEVSDLYIELTAFDRVQTNAFVQESLHRAGCDRRIFTKPALDLLYEKSNGVPRALNRLCDLCLLAGMGEGRKTIDRDIVRTANDELHTRHFHTAPCR